MSSSRTKPIEWPDGARFAFTIFDDTDMTTLENGPVVYDQLSQLGLRITKSVWPLAPAGPPRTGGATCAEPEYLSWVQGLQRDGYEIGYHNASDHPSTREETIEGLDRFQDYFGTDPRIGADHSGNLEAMYWGPARLTGARSWLYEKGTKVTRPGRPQAQGHLPDSPYYWGDVLEERIDYWRNFTFTDLNAFDSCPQVPYHDPARPHVKWWYTSTHAPTLDSFLDALAPERLDALEAAGGLAIIYTHFGTNFVKDGVLDPRFCDTMAALADRPAWCAPTSTVLDHVRANRAGDAALDRKARARMENRWIRDQVQARAGSELRKAVARRRR